VLIQQLKLVRMEALLLEVLHPEKRYLSGAVANGEWRECGSHDPVSPLLLVYAWGLPTGIRQHRLEGCAL
jgi:hypothetical protein